MEDVRVRGWFMYACIYYMIVFSFVPYSANESKTSMSSLSMPIRINAIVSLVASFQ